MPGRTEPGEDSPTALRVLGVDPGSVSTGWGLLGGSPSRPRLIDCGVLSLGSRGSFAERLSHLQRELTDLVGALRPTTSAVESPFHGASARSALKLAHARGVILAVLAGAGVEVTEYAPAAVKNAVAGSGRADKEQVAAMVRRFLDLDEQSRQHDLTDALAVALCHLSSTGFRAAVADAERGRRRARPRAL